MALTLLLGGLTPHLLWAQPVGVRPTIRQIQVEGLKAIAEETLLYYLDVKEGQPLDVDALDRNIHELWDRELIEDIVVEAEPVPGGVGLVIRAKERLLLRSIDYEGLTKISRGDIEDRIVEERIEAFENVPLRLGELNRIKVAVEELYAEKGYRFAEVTLRLEQIGPGEVRVLFTVDEGDRVRIGDIDFEGNAVFKDSRLRSAMKNTKESGLISRIRKKDIFKDAAFQEDLEKVQEVYRKEGYKNVVIGEPKYEFREKGDKRRMVITVPIEEGERWRFGEVTVEGNERYSDQALLRAFRYKPGSWLRSIILDEAVETIDELYKNTGFLFARVDVELRERGEDENIADVIVHIEENDQFRVGRIEFEGNRRTKDKVLRRELGIQESFVVNIGAVRNSVFRINRLGYFTLDEEDPVRIDVNQEDKTVDLVFQGEESDRTEVQFGGGFSEVEGFFGQAALRTQNFLGRGETFGVSIQIGRISSLFDISYFVPWFLDRPQNLGLRVFKSELDFRPIPNQQFTSDRTGGSLTYGRRLGPYQTLSLAVSQFSFDDVVRTPGGDAGDAFVSSFDLETRELRPFWIFDNRDSRFEATRGRRLSTSLRYAGGFLGGTQSFISPRVQFSWFKPVSRGRLKTVFATNIEAAYITPFDDSDLARADQFFLGGDNNIRGFSLNSVTPIDDNGDPILENGLFVGGDKMLLVNLEYHFLTGGPFRVVAFVDTGGVFTENQSMDFDKFRTTAGLEMRINVPLFGAPLRFIWAQNLDPLPQDQFESFDFGIGTSF